jgi:hypothetical protein
MRAGAALAKMGSELAFIQASKLSSAYKHLKHLIAPAFVLDYVCCDLAENGIAGMSRMRADSEIVVNWHDLGVVQQPVPIPCGVTCAEIHACLARTNLASYAWLTIELRGSIVYIC